MRVTTGTTEAVLPTGRGRGAARSGGMMPRGPALAALAWLALLGGCVTAPPAVLPDVAPDDFSLGVVVQPGLAGQPPRRYVLDADGTLRAAVGGGAAAATLPPAVRRVDARTRERLWALARDSYVLDPGNPYRDDAPALHRPEPGVSVALVRVTAGGVRRGAALDLAGEAGPFVQPLLDELASLSWQESTPVPAP